MASSIHPSIFILIMIAVVVCESGRLFRDIKSIIGISSIRRPSCELEGAELNLAFHQPTNRCYALNTVGPCPENMKFYSKRWPSEDFGDCYCDRDLPCVYNSSTQKCHRVFEKAYCSDGHWLRLNEFGNLNCESNPCPQKSTGKDVNPNSYVLLNGVCARLGYPCGISAYIGFRGGNFEPECLRPVEDLTSPIFHTESISCENGMHWSKRLKICEVSAEDLEFRKVALNATNVYRARHNASAIVEDEAIHKIAQTYADKLVNENSLEPSKRKGYGENLYRVKRSLTSKSELVLEAINHWYNEVKDYDYNLPLFDTHTAHFTQLVWRGTKKHGIGIGYNPTFNYSVVVINYLPPGNRPGDFFENVGQPLTNVVVNSEELDKLFKKSLGEVQQVRRRGWARYEVKVYYYSSLCFKAERCLSLNFVNKSYTLSYFVILFFDQFFDADKSGEIEKADFELAVERVCQIRGWATGTSKYDETKKNFLSVWDALKLRADDNGDEQVSREEWLGLWANPSNDDWQNLYMKFMFNLQDTSRDGNVDLDEFIAVCSSFGVSVDESKNAFDVVSKNGSVTVDLDYYSKLWKEFFYSDDKNAPGNAIFGKKSF